MLFDGTDIGVYGLVLLKKPGAYNLPSRQEPTFYDWGDELSPLLEAEEIFFQANVFTMELLYDYRRTVNTVDQALAFLEGLGEFDMTFDEATGSYGVLTCRIRSVRSKINYRGFHKLTLTVYQRVPSFPGSIPAQSVPVGTNAIAGINASVFGIVFGKLYNGKSLGTSRPSKETVYLEANKDLDERGFKRITIPCFLVGSSPADVLIKLENFKKTITSPGAKELRHNGVIMSVFLTEGFRVDRINNKTVKFDLTLNLMP